MNDDDSRNRGESAGRCPKTGQFLPGNPGRLPGTRNKATKAVQQLLDEEAESVSRVCIQQALAGDTKAIRLVLERVVPPVREEPLEADLPALDGPGGVPAAIGGVWQAVAAGIVTPGQGERLARLVGGYVRARELEDIEQRLQRLEGKVVDDESASA